MTQRKTGNSLPSPLKATTFAFVIILLSGCALISPGPQEDGSTMMHIPAETVKGCEVQGGCALVSRAFLDEFARRAAAHMCGKDI